MLDRSGIFAGDDPFEIVAQWLASAGETELSDPNAVSLATQGQDGFPNVRVVLLKEIEDNAIVFYTNYTSTKGKELDASGVAAAGFHWKSLRRQIRFRGHIERVSPEQSDAYYHTRPLESRIGAWASLQSAALASRDELTQRIRDTETRFGNTPPRPAFWGGYRLIPVEIEFWADGPFRLHDRFIWRRPGRSDPWTIARLSP
ncbi:pyridoxamine 5'-phosphate oxidase [Pseudoruegeria sp. SK021]|uniref:pyridoxamine 5'-phosphate oxidase n=1 Tax=Pseudoruegeria sp. SK021 TaxID=1933035 RepID=UPI000A221A26|nr:pyridoxamine 5'-phosphate oxidase [Pseudoruegeria sp. SK021]OSP56253.1 pyridoxamine 5'-phosphate oxidase [Pseudoruegeria sp. SK021]